MSTLETPSASHQGWIDNLKAFGIIFVVLGHTLGIGKALECYIFSFHMPLFFFISGLLLTDARLAASFSDSFRHYTLRLLVPYFIFSFLTYIPWVMVTRFYGADAMLGISPWRPLIGTLYGIGVDGWLQHNAMLWFFPCLFIVHFQFKFFARIASGVFLLALLTLAAGAGWLFHQISDLRLPWGMEAALVALPFYGVGVWFRPRLLTRNLALIYVIALLVLLSCFQVWSIYTNGRVDMNFISLGNPLLFYFGAFSGISIWVLLARLVSPLTVFRKISDAAILIFPLHRVLFSVCSAVLVFVLGVDGEFKTTAFGSGVYAFSAIFVCLFLLPLARKYTPYLVGGRR